MCRYLPVPLRAGNGVSYPRAAVTDGCEPSSLGARIQIHTLWNSGYFIFRCIQVPIGAKNGYQIPWSLSYRQLSHPGWPPGTHLGL